MQQTLEKLDVKYIVGIKVRTNNEAEINQTEGKIMPCVQNYFHNTLFEKIKHRKTPGVTYCVYTEYETDHTGDYTFFIGEEVSSIEDLDEGLEYLEIPAQSYEKFTTKPGPMPDVVRGAWFEIWQNEDLTKRRSFKADFEVYDDRAQDHSNVVLDIYIGLA